MRRSQLTEQGIHRYWIPAHVYMCTTPDGVIFLDAKGDRYAGISADEALTLTKLVDNWPMDRCWQQAATAVPTPNAFEVAAALERGGLLTSDHKQGKPATRRALDLSGELVSYDSLSDERPRVRLREICNFAAAFLIAAWGMRMKSFESRLGRIQQRADRRRTAHGATNAARMVELTGVFHRLRAFVFSSHDRCLFNSLVLLEFLARYGLSATWVIGVKTRPWAAHSWVQHEHIVLDGTPERIRFYVPILAL